MSLIKLLALVRERQISVAIRVHPMLNALTVAVRAGYRDGARPVWEKSFDPDTPPMEALDNVAAIALDYWTKDTGGFNRRDWRQGTSHVQSLSQPARGAGED